MSNLQNKPLSFCYLNQFTQPDTIVPNLYNPQSLNRYAYALNNPIRYNDPSGHSVCEDVNCKKTQSPVTVTDRINKLESIIKKRFKWNIKGDDWTLKEVKTIYQTGTDILAYVNNITGGNGLDWMNKYLGGVNIQHYDSNRNSALPGIGSTTVNLFRGWLTQDGGARWLAHELGHVWDINTGLFGVYGGVSDQLNADIGGDRLSNPFSCSFCDVTGLQHIPVENQWLPKTEYGNNSTNDYLAESFALSVYPSGGSQVPVRAKEWVKWEILIETVRLITPLGTQIGLP